MADDGSEDPTSRVLPSSVSAGRRRLLELGLVGPTRDEVPWLRAHVQSDRGVRSQRQILLLGLLGLILFLAPAAVVLIMRGAGGQVARFVGFAPVIIIGFILITAFVPSRLEKQRAAQLEALALIEAGQRPRFGLPTTAGGASALVATVVVASVAMGWLANAQLRTWSYDSLHCGHVDQDTISILGIGPRGPLVAAAPEIVIEDSVTGTELATVSGPRPGHSKLVDIPNGLFNVTCRVND